MKELVYHRQYLPVAARNPDKVGFVDGEYRGTYATHTDRVARACSVLRTLGVKKDDRFAVMALNSHRFLELYHAAFLGAGVINPLNLRLAPRRSIEVHPARLGDYGLLRRRRLRPPHRPGPRRDGAGARGAARPG